VVGAEVVIHGSTLEHRVDGCEDRGSDGHDRFLTKHTSIERAWPQVNLPDALPSYQSYLAIADRLAKSTLLWSGQIQRASGAAFTEFADDAGREEIDTKDEQ
jgi:hypothetical protein